MNRFESRNALAPRDKGGVCEPVRTFKSMEDNRIRPGDGSLPSPDKEVMKWFEFRTI